MKNLELLVTQILWLCVLPNETDLRKLNEIFEKIIALIAVDYSLRRRLTQIALDSQRHTLMLTALVP
jgi:hypothetical protein